MTGREEISFLGDDQKKKKRRLVIDVEMIFLFGSFIFAHIDVDCSTICTRHDDAAFSIHDLYFYLTNHSSINNLPIFIDIICVLFTIFDTGGTTHVDIW
jgi:hypothetical protein